MTGFYDLKKEDRGGRGREEGEGGRGNVEGGRGKGGRGKGEEGMGKWAGAFKSTRILTVFENAVNHYDCLFSRNIHMFVNLNTF